MRIKQSVRRFSSSASKGEIVCARCSYSRQRRFALSLLRHWQIPFLRLHHRWRLLVFTTSATLLPVIVAPAHWTSALPGRLPAFTGTANGSTILGLSSYAGADNLLYDGSNGTNAWLDFSGLSFSVLGNAFGIGNTGLGDYGVTDMISNPAGVCCGSHPAELNIAAVPEPATWAMMLLGFAGIGFAMREKRRNQALPQVA